MLSFIKKFLLVTLLIAIPVVAMDPKGAGADPKIEQQLQAIIKGLADVKIPNKQAAEVFYPELDKSPRKSAVMRSVLEQYLNPAKPFASSFAKKIIELYPLRVVSPFPFGTKGAVSVAFSPDGKKIASGLGNAAIRLWDTVTNTLIEDLLGHVEIVTSVAFSPNGTKLASGSRDKTVKLWNMATNTLIATLEGHAGAVRSLAFSPDGTRLASVSSDKTIKLWNMTTNTLISTLEGRSEAVTSVAFSPDGTKLAFGSMTGFIELWNMATNTLIIRWRSHTRSVCSVAFSPDGTKLACASIDNIKLWDMTTNTLISTLEGHALLSVVFSPDGTILNSASSNGIILLWDLRRYVQLPQFLKSLYADTKGLKKFLLLNAIFDNYEKKKQPLKIYQPEAIALLKDLPTWLQKPLQDQNMVRVFTKIQNK